MRIYTKLFEFIDEKKFIIDNENGIFKLFLGDTLVARSYFYIEQADELFNQKYVGIFKVETNIAYRGKGYMRYLLEQIFNYVKNEFSIDYILLNVYKDNKNALNLYFKVGFEIYKDFDEYFTLIKNI